MNRVFAGLVCFFVICTVAGCGDAGNQVTTQDEMKAHVEKYGDTALDPGASTPLTD